MEDGLLSGYTFLILAGMVLLREPFQTRMIKIVLPCNAKSEKWFAAARRDRRTHRNIRRFHRCIVNKVKIIDLARTVDL